MNIDFVLSSHGMTGKKSKDKVPPPPITNFLSEPSNKVVKLTWNNPIDSDFVGLRIQRKTGSYPTSYIDGTTIFNGVASEFVDTELKNGIDYYYRAFTYDFDNNFNQDISQQLVAQPFGKTIYGVKIDTTNSNPETSVTYIEDSVGFESAKGNNGSFSYGSWADEFPFNQIKPCLLKNGTVNYYVNPNDYTKKEDGSNADITSGADGDVMIEFPKIYWKFETVGTDLYIRYSNEKVDESYKCLAHTRATEEKNNIYLSAYMGAISNSRLRSLSGFKPEVNRNIGNFRAFAQIQGAGYEQFTYYQILMLQVLYIVMFKNRDSQNALGRGYTDKNTTSAFTGTLNKSGLFYGDLTGKTQMKFCGIEDFWGNTYYWIDGLYIDSSRNILIGNSNFSNIGSGYANFGQAATSNLVGYIDQVQGGTETGFISKSNKASGTTHYSDYGGLGAGYLPQFGGDIVSGDYAGAFLILAYYSSSYSYAYLSSRLSYY